MKPHIYDTIVIGAGGMGSSTAYHLAKSGADVLVLEQFQRGHAFGSSHGETRIIRFFYDKPFYTELMKAAYAEWRALESAADQTLLFITGSVGLGASGNMYGISTRSSLDAAGIESEWWDTQQLANRFPQFHVSKEMDILWQKDTGFLHAAKCVSTHLQLAEQHGAELREETPVTRIDWQADVPTVYTETGRFHGRKVVAASGAWTGGLLAELNLPLTVTRQQVCYYQPIDAAQFQPNRFPVFVEVTADDEFFYGLPAFGKNGLKVARHGRGQSVSPDTCNRTPDAEYLERMQNYVQQRLPGVGKVGHAEICLYTETPDEDFIIDVHPRCPDLLIAAGFSGHGFKFCALVGRILSELVLTGETAFDIRPFRMDREYGTSSGTPRLQRDNKL